MMEGEITEPQRKLLFSQMGKGNVSKDEIENQLGFGISQLTKNEASKLIDCLITNGDLAEVIKNIKHAREHPDKHETAPMPSTPKQEFHVEPGSSLALARAAGIPDEMANLFFMNLNGNAYTKVAGLLYMAGKIGYRRIEITDKYDEETKTWIAEAKVYPKIDIKMLEAVAKLAPAVQEMAFDVLSKPTNGIGTANTSNVLNPKMHPFLREMAQTRALGRALRPYTGYGSTTYEELPDAEIREE